MKGRKVIWVVRLPQIDPPFAEDQRWRDGCMMPPITLRQRLLRQIRPRRNGWNCCLYHRQNLHAIADAVNTAYRQMSRLGLEGDDADEFIYQFLDGAGLTKDERMTAILLLDNSCGIWVSRLPGDAAGHIRTAGTGRGP